MVWLSANLSLCTHGPEFARMLLPEGRVVTWVMERGRVQPMPVCLSRFYGCVEWECCAVFWSATGKPRKSTSTCEFILELLLLILFVRNWWYFKSLKDSFYCICVEFSYWRPCRFCLYLILTLLQLISNSHDCMQFSNE